VTHRGSDTLSARVEDGHPVSWEVLDEQLAYEEGEPYLDLIAARDYSELEEIPDHELEHTLGKKAEELPDTAAARLAQAAELRLSVEMVALEPGEEADWVEAEGYIDALILAEIEDDLLELCGVDPDNDPRDTWLDKVKERLDEDLRRFRRDGEGDHDEIEEWEFADGRVFAAVGSPDDEADPDKGYGWMCRLVDGGVLGAAGLERVRKAELQR
jgi:hypothetical protein